MSPAAGTRKRVVVVGGGITGLAVAQRLKEHADVVVVEAADQVGGKFGTVDIGGVTFESGPDAFVAREPHLPALAAQLGLAGELISPAIFGAHIWTGGKLERVPPD